MGGQVKQVIVWRNDLKVRKGKFAAQVAHASLASILKHMPKLKLNESHILRLEFKSDSYLDKWINGKFTKIVVGCENEAELLELYKQAEAAKIPVVLITDAGLTEFNGVPTNTCIGIGPFWSEEIDKVTGHLKLL